MSGPISRTARGRGRCTGQPDRPLRRIGEGEFVVQSLAASQDRPEVKFLEMRLHPPPRRIGGIGEDRGDFRLRIRSGATGGQEQEEDDPVTTSHLGAPKAATRKKKSAVLILSLFILRAILSRPIRCVKQKASKDGTKDGKSLLARPSA